MDAHFDSLLELMLRFDSQTVYERLVDRVSDAHFGRFSCKLLARCAGLGEDDGLRQAVLGHLQKEVENSPRFMEFFERVDQETCRAALERVRGLESLVRQRILRMAKAIHARIGDFAELRRDNRMFEMCLDDLIESDFEDFCCELSDSFFALEEAEHKRLFVGGLCRVDVRLARRVLGYWFERVLEPNGERREALYFRVLFETVRLDPNCVDILDSNLAEISSRLSVPALDFAFTRLERLARNPDCPGQWKKTLRKRRKAAISEHKIRLCERAWKKYLSMSPESRLANGLWGKVTTAFDELVNSLSVEDRVFFKKDVSRADQLGETEKEAIAEFAEEHKKAQLFDPDDGFDDRSELEKLVLLSKLYSDSTSWGLFKLVIGACEAQPKLKKLVLKSDAIGLLVEFAHKVRAGDLSVAEVVVIRHFRLAFPIKTSLALSVDWGSRPDAPLSNSPELAQAKSDFKDAYEGILRRVDYVTKNEQILRRVREQPVLGDLLGARRLAQCRQVVDSARALGSLPASSSSHQELLALDLTRLDRLRCPVRLRVFLLFCFARGHFDVLRNSHELSTPELSLLCQCLGHRRDGLPEQCSYLGLGEFNALFDDIEAYWSYLNAKYFQPGLDAVDWDVRPQIQTQTGFSETPRLFEFLLAGPTQTPGGLGATARNPADQSKLTRFADRIADLESLAVVKRALDRLPSKFASVVGRVSHKLSAFVKRPRNELGTLEQLVSRERRLRARVDKLRELAQHGLFCELFVEDLTVEIEKVGADLRQPGPASKLYDFDLESFRSLLVHEASAALVEVLVDKIKADKLAIQSVRTLLDRKEGRNGQLEEAITELKTQNARLKGQIGVLMDQLDKVVKAGNWNCEGGPQETPA